MKNKSILWISLVGIIIVLLIAFKSPINILKNKEKKPEKISSGGGERALAIEGFIAKPEPFENNILSTGTILPNEQVELRSEIAGRVTGINFKEDSPVKKGQVLVTIYDRDIRAQLSKLSSQLKLAQEDEARKSKLKEIKGISQEEYDRAASLVLTLKADEQLLLSQLEKTEIRAPFNGVIGLRHISEGGYISPNTLIANMLELNPVKVEFSIPEKYAGQIKKGTKITFSIAGSDRKYQGTVYAAATSIDLNTRTVTLRAVAPNPDLSLTPGAFVKVEYTMENIKDAILVPAEALVPELGRQIVYVAQNGKALKVPVETGIRTDNKIQITGGISPLDTVIVTGLLQIKDGSIVSVTKVVEEGLE